LALPFLLFPDVLLGHAGFYFRDLTRYFYPAKQILREIVQSGEFPYWNRYFSAGQPMAANPEHEVFYPLTYLVLLPSYNFGFRLLILLHISIALGGMYALLRSMELRPFAAWFGAVSWGVGGLILSYVNLLPYLFCAAWLPFTCLFARRFLLRRNGRDFALASLFLGLQLLVGEPTTVLQTGMLLGGYALYRGLRNVPWIAAIGAAGLAVGAAQVLPMLDHVRDSVRARPFTFDLVATWSMPWAKLGEIVYPQFLGHVPLDPQHVYWAGRLYPGVTSPFLLNIYAGILVIALAAGAAFVRPRGGRLVLILCAVSVLLALGDHTPLLRWLYDAGIFSNLRYPEKFALLGIVTLVVFAAQMLDRLMSGDARLRAATLAILGATTVVALIAAATMREARIDWIVAAVRGAVAMAIVALAARRNERAWMAATAIFVVADLAFALREITPRLPRRFFDPPPIAAAFPPDHQRFRLFPQIDWYEQTPFARTFHTLPAQAWTMRNGLYPMTTAGVQLQSVLERDTDRTALLPTAALTDAMWDVKRSGRADWYEPFMAMSNAWYRAVDRDLQHELQRTGGDVTAMKPAQFAAAARPYPRYAFAGQLISIRGKDDLVAALREGRYDARTAFVEAPAFAPATGVVRGVRETPNSASLDVESFGRGFLVMSVTRHKYWDVRIDGARVQPIATNLAYQGVVVPPGRHRVTMVYRNPLVLLGGVISAVVIAVLVWIHAAESKKQKAEMSAAIARNRRISAFCFLLSAFPYNPRAWRTAAQT
jgi:hypothetical protein